MKQVLQEITTTDLYHYRDGERIQGIHNKLKGNCTGLEGNLDNAQLTREERAQGVNIRLLVKGE